MFCLMGAMLSLNNHLGNFVVSSFIDNVKEQSLSIKNFLNLKSPREKKLAAVYSSLSVLVAIIVGTISSGGESGSVGGSRSLFIVNSVYTYPNFSMSQFENQSSCAELNQQVEYDKLLSDGWRITSSQSEEKSVTGQYSGSFSTGKCIGTLYILNK